MSKKSSKSSKVQQNTEKFWCYFPVIFCLLFLITMVIISTKKYNKAKTNGATNEELKQMEKNINDVFKMLFLMILVLVIMSLYILIKYGSDVLSRFNKIMKYFLPYLLLIWMIYAIYKI